MKITSYYRIMLTILCSIAIHANAQQPTTEVEYQTKNLPQRSCQTTDFANRTPLIACALHSNAIELNELVINGSACFQGPVQLCSAAELPGAFLEGLWFIGTPDTIPLEGFSSLQDLPMRAVSCSAADTLTILFNQTTKDPADAFTLLKTVQPGNRLRFTQIAEDATCSVVRIVETEAFSGPTGCGTVFALPVCNAPGLIELYSDTGCISLLNFGPAMESLTGTSGVLCFCWNRTFCPSSICSAVNGEFVAVLPPACDPAFVDESILLSPSEVAPSIIASNSAADQADATTFLANIKPNDLIRLYQLFGSNCRAGINDLRVIGANEIVGSNSEGVGFCNMTETLTDGGNATGFCLANFKNIPSAKDCWFASLCTGIDLNALTPIPSGCTCLPYTVLVNSLDTLNLSAAAFSLTNNNGNASNLLQAIQVGDCIKLYNGFVFDLNQQTTYEVAYTTKDAECVVLGLTNPQGVSGALPEVICLKNYGKCC